MIEYVIFSPSCSAMQDATEMKFDTRVAWGRMMPNAEYAHSVYSAEKGCSTTLDDEK